MHNLCQFLYSWHNNLFITQVSLISGYMFPFSIDTLFFDSIFSAENLETALTTQITYIHASESHNHFGDDVARAALRSFQHLPASTPCRPLISNTHDQLFSMVDFDFPTGAGDDRQKPHAHETPISAVESISLCLPPTGRLTLVMSVRRCIWIYFLHFSRKFRHMTSKRELEKGFDGPVLFFAGILRFGEHTSSPRLN